MSISEQLNLNPQNPILRIGSEEECIQVLRELFSTQKTLKIITTLLAQSKGINDES